MSTHNILVAGKIHASGLALLNTRKDVTVTLVEDVAPKAYLPFLPAAHGLLLRTQPLTPADVAAAPHLKIVSRHGVGYDAVDVPALNARRIPLAIVGDVNSRAVAEHTLMLMLAAARRTVAHHLASIGGNWNERNKFDSYELDGRRLLIVGFGRIGKRVAVLAKAFGMTIAAYDPFLRPEQIAAEGAESEKDLAEGLTRADFVTLHMPGHAGGPLIGAKELSVMKSSAIIVNAARGGLIDEAALDAALRARKLRGAAVDVLSQEPPTANHPLLSNPHVSITPHNAGLTEECAERMAIASAQNILDCFDGKLDMRLVVNAKEIA